MKQTTKRFLSVILGLILLILSFVVYIDFIVPAYASAQSLKAQILSLDNFLTAEKDAVSKVQNLISAYKSEEDLQRAVSLALPQNEDVVGAVAQVSGLIQISGVSLESLSTLSVTSGGQKPAKTPLDKSSFVTPIGTSVIQFKLVGPYDNLKIFLSRLETNMRIFDIKTLVLQPTATAAGRNAQPVYSYDVSVGTYYQAQP